MKMRRLLYGALPALLLVVGCSSGPSAADAGLTTDAGVDAGVDAGADAGADGGRSDAGALPPGERLGTRIGTMTGGGYTLDVEVAGPASAQGARSSAFTLDDAPPPSP